MTRATWPRTSNSRASTGPGPACGGSARCITAAWAAAAARRTGRVLTIEEHSEVGGLAAIAAEVAGRHKLSVDLRHIALPDKDLEVGVPAGLYEYYGLTAENVVATALELARS